MEISSLEEIEKNIDYTFNRKDYLIESLTHPSYMMNNFQTLEFLGDRILGSIIATLIYKKNLSIKSTSQQYNNLIDTETLAEVAKNWKVKDFLKHNIQRLSNKLLADVVEAIIAAVYLDSNYEIVSKFVDNMYEKILINNIDKLDFKSQLQELALSKKLGTPIYTVIKEEIKMNQKVYTMQVEVGSFKANAKNFSKHKASKKAAETLFNKIK